MSRASQPEAPAADLGTHLRHFNDFMLGYKFAIDEVVTKIQILREDFNHAHDYNPIEHIGSRLKTSDSILAKVRRKGQSLDLDSIRRNVLDIAGVRVTCCFLGDTYTVRDAVVRQSDLRLLEERDYIANPKPNGYQSLHLIVEVPVHRASSVSRIPVEVQLRTIAMDFWASLEHKIFYKYAGAVPPGIVADLSEAAAAASALDARMQELHGQVQGPPTPRGPVDPPADLFVRYARALEGSGRSGVEEAAAEG